MNAEPGKFLTAQWRWLAMLNYEVDPAILLPLVPRGTELDLWQGRAYVSMVGFRFLRTRVLGVPVPFHRDFDEVNLRFYVRRRVGAEWRRGVVFIKEIVARFLVTWVARTIYNEKYVTMPMRSRQQVPGEVAYEWNHGPRWNVLSATVEGEPVLADDTSEECFITEHYHGYVVQRDGSTKEYLVEHPRWKVWRATASRFDCEVAALYAPEFVPYLAKPPTTAFVADGSEVVVRKGVRIA